MALYEGQMLGPYQIIGQLGQGGMATVYKAYHAKLDRYVAIKVMHPAFKDDGNFLARFEREAQIVAKLEHPHIVQVYDYAEHDGQPYLVMKFIEGRTLKRILSAAPPTLDDILNILTPIAAALTYAHKQGVLHRDIKPSNIVLDNNNVPYLTDFGLARIAQAGESTMSADMILGTPQYISPEQARGEKNLDYHTDLYSLGVILYEMVVGRVPFNADTPYAIVHDQIYTDLPLPSKLNPEVPPPVEKVLLKALAKNPADRFGSATEMIDAFRKAAAESGLKALNPERDKVAEAKLNELENSPTISVDAQSAPAERIPAPRTAGRIPPGPPTPPVPFGAGRAWDAEHSRRGGGRDRGRGNIEAEIDLGDLGRRAERQMRKGARYIEKIAESIEEAARERGPLTEEERIRMRIEKKFKERQGLLSHGVSFISVNLVLWLIWFFSSQSDLSGWLGGRAELPLPWPIFVTFFWGIGMVAHYVDYNGKYGRGANRREEEIQREIEREQARRSSLSMEKPKNDQRMRLTEDGELEAVPDDEISEAEKRKRNR
ncbi:MAG: protein kinase [Chloroflexota bacterium]